MRPIIPVLNPYLPMPELHWIQDTGLWWLLFGLICIAVSCGITGVFLTLKGEALSGDVMAHGILPGLVFAFMLSGSRELIWLIPGAALSGALTLSAKQWLIQKVRVRPDTAAAMALSVFYGLGIVLLSKVRQSGNAAQAGLDRFLFGSAAAMLSDEVWIAALLAVAVILIIIAQYRGLSLWVFDPEFAAVSGFPVRRISFILTFLTLMCVITGVQLLGVVLVASLLVAPAVAASAWTHALPIRLVLAACFACLAVLGGGFISASGEGMPTGPWIVVILSVFAFIGVGKKYFEQQQK
jgi:manganese/zinc/iron transport system permease protein